MQIDASASDSATSDLFSAPHIIIIVKHIPVTGELEKDKKKSRQKTDKNFVEPIYSKFFASHITQY